MAVKLLQVLVLAVIAAAADDDVPVTWVPSPRALLQCQVPDAARIPARRPPPPLEGEERTKLKPYIWRRNGKELKRSSSGSLEVPRKKNSDAEGLYQCAVRHQAGLVLGYPENLRFAYIEKQFSVHPANASAWRGQPYALTCDISSGPPAAVSWLRDGQPLPDDSRYHILNNQLIISRVTDEDAGFYRCRATNTNLNKSRTSHGGRLQVEESPSFLEPSFVPVQHPGSIAVPRGSRVVLPCPMMGNPKPTLIWELTQSGQRIAELEATDELLVMETIELDQEGVYVCRVEGQDHLRKTFQVVITSPVNITHPPESKQVVRASTVRFNCSASGSPTPKVTWYKDGELLKLEGRIDVVWSADDNKLPQLLIRSVTSADAGVYQCFARNSISAQSAWATLNVTGGEAAAPADVRCWPVGATDVALRWRGVPDVIAYTVQYTVPDGTSLPGQPVIEEEAVVNVKSPLTVHNFQVRAYIGSPTGNKNTAVLVSDMSESVTCQGQGVHIKLAKVGEDKILVSWDPVSDEFPGVLRWILQYKAENSTNEHNITLDGQIYNHTLRVKPSQPLQVRVLGTRYLPWLHQNLTLVPWTSTSAAGRDPGFGEVRAVPVDVEVTEVNPRNLTVRWRCEEEFLPKTYTFLVCWRKLGGNEECLDSMMTSAQVMNLEPDSSYEVRVQARLPGQTRGGDFSKPIPVSTPPEGQQNFRDLTYKYINSTTVRVSWNSEYKESIVRYTDDYNMPRNQWVPVDATGNTILLTGIDPTKNLSVIVEGEKPLRHSSLLKIPAYMPEATNLGYQYTSAGILVTWTGGGPRVVHYSQNLTQPMEKWPTIDVTSATGGSVEIAGVDPARATFVMVAAPAPSARSQVLSIGPRPPAPRALYLGVGVASVLVVGLSAAAAVCVWQKRKRTRSPVRLRRTDHNDAEEEGAEMRNVGGRLANGGGSKEAGEPLLNGHVNITENPTQSKTPNGKVKHFEGAFDVTRYGDAECTLETVVDTSASLLDASRRDDFPGPPADCPGPPADFPALPADYPRLPGDYPRLPGDYPRLPGDYPKLPDDNMNSELTRDPLGNSKVLPTLQPNG